MSLTAKQTYSEQTHTEYSLAGPKDYFSLLKPRVMSLVVFTGLVGLMAAPVKIHPILCVITILCIALGSGAAGAINMWFDRDIDAIMQRTVNRAIPRGIIPPSEALAFGIILSLISVVMLGLSTNWFAAFLLLDAILFYVFIYTIWLKRRTPQNIVIGGAAGAFPPLIGWAAMTGSVEMGPIILFLLIFMWTPPHFWALALFRSQDYEKATVPMLPVTHGIESTKKHVLVYSILLVPIAVLPYFYIAKTSLYLSLSLVFSAYFLYLAWRVCGKDEGFVYAKKLFVYSIKYLFLLFFIILMHYL